MIDEAREHGERDSYSVHVLIDSPVVRHAIDAPRSLTLAFENDCPLTVFDDSKHYESFSIQPGDVNV